TRECLTMKRFTIVLLTCGVVAVAVAQVTPEEHAAHHPPAVATAESTPADMHQHMKDMQTLMEKIEKTKDPAERRRLLDQHRKAMREQLHSMMQNDKGMKMGMGMGTGMGMGMGKSGSMMECHEHMRGQMDMMMGMMDQLMRHEDAQRSPRK
ncbi:MAG TPA: hypothetical protein VFO82_06570, partial [Steroidobacteraceae bacterium]|nr:hypothetical protein [Steroidobacteraceae bacterium]